MGVSESQERIGEFQRDFIEQKRTQRGYFGTHVLLINRFRQELFIKKQFVFHSGQEYGQFLSEWEKIERKPFNVIYPRLVISGNGFEKCSSLHEANVYLEYMGRTLAQVVKQEGRFSQSRAWFLLNELSKSLQILGESGRAHWGVGPQTVFQNGTQNYFLYDSLFVLGFDPLSYLTVRLDNKEPISEKVQGLVQRGAQVGVQGGHQEDMYALGLTVLFALTGRHPNSLPKKYSQRQQSITEMMQEERNRVSRDLVDILQMLTERESGKRMDCYQLRRLLKDKEADIIHNENEDYLQSKRKHEGYNREREKERRIAQSQKIGLGHRLSHDQLQVQPTLHVRNYRQSFGVVLPQQREGVHQREAVVEQPTQTYRFLSPSTPLKIKLNNRLYEEMSQAKPVRVPADSLQTTVPQVNLSSQRQNPLPRIHSFDRLQFTRK